MDKKTISWNSLVGLNKVFFIKSDFFKFPSV